ncbi:uncharacterized protein BX664DRAFT_327666 [Halteromyces radiatus]|uniref:uncharacterized protein n=1 Tax=Halteromyces radiatus TaxID=101107 RepID=UPI00221FA1C8|nr:uncharacterized protein BX664DRAFT_327666 [Halteromyces radiatus]KAI8092594.1 hypothetical protein BX664DRAFT_327666 [Halteromyces radiatus]
MKDTKYHNMMQQHNIHPLSASIPHPSITLQQQQPTTASSTSNSTGLVQDAPTSPIDFTNNDALFMSPLSRTSPLDDFEDVDYQSGLTSYQKQHMVSRHPSLPNSNSMDIPPSSNIPIHSMKQGTSPSSSTFYTGPYDTFPMSAPANIGHFGPSSPPSSLHYLSGDNAGAPVPMPTSSSSSLFIHPQQPYQQQQQQMDSPGSAARSFEEDDYNLQMNMQMMMDKRRRRRESHNAVERRRRENINERIQELGTLLPEMMAETNANNKPNKGAILRHSVDHIRHLQQEVNSYSRRVQELEAALAKLQSK